jgi:hypothetical protein
MSGKSGDETGGCSSSGSVSTTGGTSDSEAVVITCNWCGIAGRLMKGKPYCSRCHEKCFRECVRCHRPLPHESYFKQSDVRCNACHCKYLRERKRRQDTNLSSDKNKKKPSSNKTDLPVGPLHKIRRGRPPSGAVTKQKARQLAATSLCQCEDAVRQRLLSGQATDLGFQQRKIGYIPIFM